MFRKGEYYLHETYYNDEEFFIVKHFSRASRHTHIPKKYGYGAARMILIRAARGQIPKHYPDWMVTSINRLWFGHDFMTRTDIDNTNLFTNDPRIRVITKATTHRKKKKKQKGHKGYYDNHVFMAHPCN